MPPADPDSRPRLRPTVAAGAASADVYQLWDQVRLTPAVVHLSAAGLEIVRLFTGSRTLRDVQTLLAKRIGPVPLDTLAELVGKLDDALLLDSPAFRDYLAGPTRRPSCIGCYPASPDAIRPLMRSLFTAPGGPGLPAAPGPSPDGRLRAVLLPHMDYKRGGVTYGWGFKELAERTDARLFVVVATSHYSPHRFTLTRMNFQTPLGTVETDQRYIDRIADHYGDGLFADPAAHLPEHSVELELVPLQFLNEGKEPFRIVPLVVGSFRDCVADGTDPRESPDVGRMIAALRAAEAAAGEPVCYLISGDLAHIGPKFDDPDPVDEPRLAASRARDDQLCDRLAAADPAGYFRLIAAEGDERRICGLPPTYLTLAAAEPTRGRVLHYNRYVHPAGHESVSFAAAAFYG